MKQDPLCRIVTAHGRGSQAPVFIGAYAPMAVWARQAMVHWRGFPGSSPPRQNPYYRQSGPRPCRRKQRAGAGLQDLPAFRPHAAVSDLTGETGMRIVRAIVAGERDPRQLVALRHKRCAKSAEEFRACLTGTWRDEHLFNLQAALRLYDTVQESIADYERQLLEELEALWPEECREEPVPPHPNPKKEQAMRSKGQLDERAALWRVTGVDLTRIDGIGTGAARMILTEAGPDLSAFPDERHFASWLRLTPRTAVSGGKPLHGKKNCTGSTRIAGVLRMAAVSLQHSDSALGAAFRRIARKLAHLVYRALRYGQEYVDMGAERYEQRYRKQAVSNLKARADNLGYDLVPHSPAAAA